MNKKNRLYQNNNKAKKDASEYRFDFEAGYFIKSPCRECSARANLPECADTCRILDKIHTLLTGVISCTRN